MDSSDPFQLRLEGDGAGCGDAVELNDVGALARVGIEDRAGAEHAVAHPRPGREKEIVLRFGQERGAALDVFPGTAQQLVRRGAVIDQVFRSNIQQKAGRKTGGAVQIPALRLREPLEALVKPKSTSL